MAGWMPKDTATWLAIISLILIIPFNFFSSWAYPKLQNWWAARSLKSLKKRIEKLKATLAGMYEGYGLSVTEDWVLRCTEQLASLIYWSVVFLMFIAVILTPPLGQSFNHTKLVVFMLTVGFATFRLTRDYLMADISRFRRFTGPVVKIELEQTIKDLEAKLAARENRKSG